MHREEPITDRVLIIMAPDCISATCLSLPTQECPYAYEHAQTRTHTHTHARIFICIHICMHAQTQRHTSIRVWECTHTYTHMDTHTHTPRSRFLSQCNGGRILHQEPAWSHTEVPLHHTHPQQTFCFILSLHSNFAWSLGTQKKCELLCFLEGDAN